MNENDTFVWLFRWSMKSDISSWAPLFVWCIDVRIPTIAFFDDYGEKPSNIVMNKSSGLNSQTSLFYIVFVNELLLICVHLTGWLPLLYIYPAWSNTNREECKNGALSLMYIYVNWLFFPRYKFYCLAFQFHFSSSIEYHYFMRTWRILAADIRSEVSEPSSSYQCQTSIRSRCGSRRCWSGQSKCFYLV